MSLFTSHFFFFNLNGDFENLMLLWKRDIIKSFQSKNHLLFHKRKKSCGGQKRFEEGRWKLRYKLRSEFKTKKAFGKRVKIKRRWISEISCDQSLKYFPSEWVYEWINEWSHQWVTGQRIIRGQGTERRREGEEEGDWQRRGECGGGGRSGSRLSTHKPGWNFRARIRETIDWTGLNIICTNLWGFILFEFSFLDLLCVLTMLRVLFTECWF